MRLYYLDNGLLSKGVHSYGMALALKKPFLDIFKSCEIVAAASADKQILSELGALPHFRDGLYDHALPRPTEWLGRISRAISNRVAIDVSPSEAASFRVLNARYRRDLARLPPQVWQSGSVAVIPGIMQHQIYGLAAYMASLPTADQPIIVCGLMFSPSYLPWGAKSRDGRAYYKKAFELIRHLMGASIFFVTENNAMQEMFQAEFGIASMIIPIPLVQERPVMLSKNPKRPHLGFFGYSKCEKGFHLLPEALSLVRTVHPDFDVTVQIQHGRWERDTVDAEAALRRDATIRILEGALDQDRYFSETDQIDVMLLPYDPTSFGMRGSGIFMESAAAGRLIVASEGIHAATYIQGGHIEGETFSPYDASALAAAIIRLLQRFPEAAKRARSNAVLLPPGRSAISYANLVATIAHLKSSNN